jgi:filamentous hemagglutinin
MENNIKGSFSLGRKDQYGQRIDIEIELAGIGDAKGKTSYLKSGWMIMKEGSIKLNTPFTGFTR